MQVKCTLLPLDIEDSPTVPRVLELIQEASHKQSFGSALYELEDLLLINRFSWPSFTEWDEKFLGIAFRPSLWTNPSAFNFSSVATEALGRLHALPQSARRAILERPYPMATSRFVDRFGVETLGYLVKLQKVRLLHNTFDKLPFVPLEHLRGIQRRLSIRGGRSRVEASRRIASYADEQTVSAMLMPEYKEDLVQLHDQLAGLDETWLRDRTKLVRLWMATAQSFFNTWRVFPLVKEQQQKALIQPAQTECPFCKPMIGKEVSPDTGPFPPFHPGCSCSISIDFEALKEKGRKSSILRDLGIKVILE